MGRRCSLIGLAVVVLGLAFSATGLGAPARAEPAKQAKPSQDEEYELQRILVDTLDQVQRNYVREVSRRKLIEAAIKGMLSELDPYSSYIGPDEMDRFRTSVESEFGGIGIQVTVEDGQLKVLSPLVGTPAYRAGLTAGDRIVEIEGTSAGEITLDEAVRRLKGKAGTQVTLTVVHPGKTAREKITLTREMIHIDTVLGDRRKPDDRWDFMLDRQRGIGYIRLSAFSRETADELDRALKEMKQEKLRGLILDLRFNPGGLLSSAIQVSDLFVSRGRIVSTAGRNSPERVWEARKEGTYDGFPMALLVNRYSASASEIVAACLQDHKRAVVIGERTWGKGSVQNVIPLDDPPGRSEAAASKGLTGPRSALKLTTAGYRRPNGKNIDKPPGAKEDDAWGVMPDPGFEVKLSPQELASLVENRRQRDIVAGKSPGEAKAKAEAPKAEPPKPEPPKAGQSKPAPGAAPAAGKDGDSKALPPATETPGEAVDRQLQKAIEYLTMELARAK